MSQINVNRIKDSNEGAPDFPSGVNVGGITSTVTLGVTNLNPTNLNVSGVVTATTLDGSLLATGTPTLGLGVTINTSGVNISGVATAGIVSATTLYGDGSNITGIALSIAPLNYNPAVYSQASHLAKASGIGLTFNQAVKAGSGNVTLSIANAGVAGTVVENFGVGNSVTYSNGDTITITPTADLNQGQDYHLSYPSGAFTNIGGDLSSVGIAYTFQTKSYSYQLWGIGGRNNTGSLGQNNEVDYSSPTQIPGTTWSRLSYNHNGVIYSQGAIKSDGTLWTWGAQGTYSTLGHNQAAPVNISSPTQVPGTNWAAVAASTDNMAFVKTDGTIWHTGRNTVAGSMGLNNILVNRSSPVQMGSDTDWDTGELKLYRGAEMCAAIKTNGTLYTWGDSFGGQLGHNQQGSYPARLNSKSSPTQIPGTTWKYVTGAEYFCLATKTDGTLWAWGYNTYGRLAQNDGVNRSSPTQIPGTTWDWINAGDGNGGVSATKTDGTLWVWGRNNAYGQLGLNDIVTRSSPTQIPGTTWSRCMSAAPASTRALKTDGTLWAWGRNNYGQLGLNQAAATLISSPTQIGSDTTWSTVGAAPGGFHIKRI